MLLKLLVKDVIILVKLVNLKLIIVFLVMVQVYIERLIYLIVNVKMGGLMMEKIIVNNVNILV